MAAQGKSDIRFFRDLEWGTHVSLFYETTEDVLDTLVPYFKAGLENNELCVWAVSTPLTEDRVANALAQGISGFDRYLALGRLEILSSREWLRDGDPFDGRRVLRRWEQELSRALAGGYIGLRAGGLALAASRPWSDFSAYERVFTEWMADRRVSAVCTYPLGGRRLEDVLDVAHVHQVTIARRQGYWEVINVAKEQAPSHPLTPRELEVLGWVAHGKTALEIGDLLGITKRTIDEHVQRVVRKLNAENRTHAVAIALRNKIVEI